jgi:hypothetical protein
MRITQGVYRAPLRKRRRGRALCATPCTSPLAQRTGMSKQLLLVKAPADRDRQKKSSAAVFRRSTEIVCLLLWGSKSRAASCGNRSACGTHMRWCKNKNEAVPGCSTAAAARSARKKASAPSYSCQWPCSTRRKRLHALPFFCSLLSLFLFALPALRKRVCGKSPSPPAGAPAQPPLLTACSQPFTALRPQNRTPSTGSPPLRCLLYHQTPAAMGGRAEHP